jgi:hypothetical protein
VGHFGPGDNGYIGLQSPAFSVKCEVLPAASILRFRFYRGNGRQTEVVFHLPYLAEEMKERPMTPVDLLAGPRVTRRLPLFWFTIAVILSSLLPVEVQLNGLIVSP